MARYIAVSAIDPGDFDSRMKYELIGADGLLEQITRKEFLRYKERGDIYIATSEWPVAIYYFRADHELPNQ